MSIIPKTMKPQNNIKRLGVIGGGQLAQMLAQAAEPLDIEIQAWVLTDPLKNIYGMSE